MMNAYLQALIDSPIDTAERANKIFLPEGRKTAPRTGKIKTTPAPGDLTPGQVRAKHEKEQAGKLSAVLDYYAGSSVTVERVAEHTKLSVVDAASAMERRGRSIPHVVAAKRMGDFYEVIGERARSVAAALDIALTTRHGQPMVGFPVHSAACYVSTLNKAGLSIFLFGQDGLPVAEDAA